MLKEAPRGNNRDDLIMSLVAAADGVPPERQEAYVRDACGSDREMADEAWRYVRGVRKIGDFLNHPIFEIGDEQPFQSGELVLDRFRIVREIDRGGMGIVYEAFDEKLRKRVAIKCAQSGFGKALPPEVNHAREISHTNVCKIHDIHVAFTPAGEVNFISMEYLDGSPLTGPVPVAQARPIALQLCAGLAEAHRHKVVHGDLKSNNVMVAKESGGGVRAVIMDFGLARLEDQDAEIRGGAPGYMAPELLGGGNRTVASDIYALGVILHELVTGDLPGNARSNRIPSRWNRVIQRCLQADPALRWNSADEIALELNPAAAKWVTAVAAATVAGAIFVGGGAPKEHIRLAVLPFAASGAEAGVADRLFRDTSLRIASLRGDKDTTVSIVPLAEIQQKGVDTLEEAQAMVQATHMLTGSIRQADGRYIVQVSLVDPSKRLPAKQWTADYSADQLRAAPVALAGVVTGALHLPPLAGVPGVKPAARADYEEGLQLVQRSATAHASLQAFERAAAADPESPVIYAAAAEACFLLKYITEEAAWLTRAADFVRQAERFNPDVAEVRKAAGYLNASAGWYQHAIIDYKRASELQPIDSVVWRRLGRAFAAANQDADAQHAFRKAIEIEPGSSRPHQELGSYFAQRANYSEAAAHFRKAANLKPDDPDTHFALGSALLNLGRSSEAEAEFRSSLQQLDSAKANHSLGILLMYQRRDREAIPYFQRALEINPKWELSLMYLGVAYRRLGRHADAAEMNRSGMQQAEVQITANTRDGFTRSMLAYFAACRGDRRRAESEAAQALLDSPEDRDTQWRVMLTYETLGRRDQTLKLLSRVPRGLLEDLSRWPDAEALHRDPGFQSLLMASRPKKTK